MGDMSASSNATAGGTGRPSNSAAWAITSCGGAGFPEARGAAGRGPGAGRGGPGFGRLWTSVIVTQIALTVTFIPVVIADMGVIWPAKKMQRSHRLALVWVWIGAVLFTLPIAYGVATTLTTDGPQGLVPSVEASSQTRIS